MSASQDASTETILTEFIDFDILAFEMDEGLQFFAVLNNTFFTDFIIAEAVQMVDEGNDFGQSDESQLADSGSEEFGQISTVEDLNP